MTPDAARRSAVAAGLSSGTLGLGVLLAPRRVAAAAGVRDHRLLVGLGVSDLLIAPGLVAAPNRVPWLAARAVANVVFGGLLLREQGLPARAVGSGILALTALDVRAIAALRR